MANMNNKSVLAVAIPVLIIVIPLLYSVAGFVFGQGGQAETPFLEIPSGENESCVRDSEYMRYHHMDLLKELRIKVVRDGEKQQIGVDSCRECHANRKQFCNKCHDAVSLYPDCWGCHYYPETPETESPGHQGE